MSRVPMAEQCRCVKPAAPNDMKIYHCQKQIGHAGAHSSGPHHKWLDEYRREKKK